MYKPHQIDAAYKIYQKLSTHRIAYLMGLPRSGKTRVAIKICEDTVLDNILVVTKKAAIPGWLSELGEVGATKNYTVTNYEQVKKLKKDYQFVVLDEAHNLGQVGKPSNRVKDLRKIAYNCPLLCLSGTPIVETPLAIYHQFCVSKFSPFDEFKNFYRFFNKYGIPHQIYINGNKVETYKKSKPELLEAIQPYTVSMTQQDAGIKHIAKDIVHDIPLNERTKQLIKVIKETQVFDNIPIDSDIKERLLVHQIETGAYVHEGKIHRLPNHEFMTYIQRTWGNYREDVAFMCHFQATKKKLEEYLCLPHIYSSNTHSEGVDLSHYSTLVIVNSDYSGARFVQRRERLTNMNRETPIQIHHLVSSDGISKAIYNAVSQKRDFNMSMYRAGKRHSETNN